MEFELIIVGGGPGGLAAALAAGRARRRTLVIDGGTPRNSVAREVHTFLSRDGTPPQEFRRLAREQIAQYPTVSFLDGVVDDITGAPDALHVQTTSEQTFTAARVLLALGLVDILPPVAGLSEFWGRGVHHCPYCDGYEYRDGKWGMLTDRPAGFQFSTLLRGWTDNLTVFTNGVAAPREEAETLSQLGIPIDTRPVGKVIGGAAGLNGLELQDGTVTPLQALFVQPAQRQTDLVARLGLKLRDDGAIERTEQGETSKPGVYAAGDCSAGPMQQATFAAAEGQRVAFGLFHQLVMKGLRR